MKLCLLLLLFLPSLGRADFPYFAECMEAGWPSDFAENGDCQEPTPPAEYAHHFSQCGAKEIPCNPVLFGAKVCIDKTDQASNKTCLQKSRPLKDIAPLILLDNNEFLYQTTKSTLDEICDLDPEIRDGRNKEHCLTIYKWPPPEKKNHHLAKLDALVDEIIFSRNEPKVTAGLDIHDGQHYAENFVDGVYIDPRAKEIIDKSLDPLDQAGNLSELLKLFGPKGSGEEEQTDPSKTGITETPEHHKWSSAPVTDELQRQPDVGGPTKVLSLGEQESCFEKYISNDNVAAVPQQFVKDLSLTLKASKDPLQRIYAYCFLSAYYQKLNDFDGYFELTEYLEILFKDGVEDCR